MKVIICEDNRVQRKSIVKIIENTIIREELNMKIELETGNMQDVLDYLDKAQNEVTIYFLDVDLGENINGIQLAEKIRKKDTNAYIVFITSHSHMSRLTFEYKVEALDYILKDELNVIKDRINSCILEIYNRCNSNNKELYTIKVGERLINLRYEDILFFETSEVKHKIRVHEVNSQIEFYGSLNDIEGILDERFIRCHKSYIVNIKNIKELDKKSRTIYMKNGQVCYASMREIKKLL